MGKPTGFLEIDRRDRGYEAPESRVKTWREYVRPLPQAELGQQAARCMNCGIPYCHNGCPVNNMIPDWNDLVYREQWQAALATLQFIWVYNDFFWALVLVQSDDKRPILSALTSLRGQYFTDNNLLAAGALIIAIPTLIV